LGQIIHSTVFISVIASRLALRFDENGVKAAHRVTARGLENVRKEPVKNRFDPTDNHGAAKTGGNAKMLAIGLADGFWVIEKDTADHRSLLLN
jgi:hypothetical protein